MEILRLLSLPVAVGVYLPISTSATMFMGGLVRWLVDRRSDPSRRTSADSGPGVLFSSGLIAGGAITGVTLTGLTVGRMDQAYDFTKLAGTFGQSSFVAMAIYVLAMAVPLYLVGRRSASH